MSNDQKFKIGDLVKHTSRIKWRNQDARGMIVETTNSMAGPSYCKVLWVNEPDAGYSNSISPEFRSCCERLKIVAKKRQTEVIIPKVGDLVKLIGDCNEPMYCGCGVVIKNDVQESRCSIVHFQDGSRARFWNCNLEIVAKGSK